MNSSALTLNSSTNTKWEGWYFTVKYSKTHFSSNIFADWSGLPLNHTELLVYRNYKSSFMDQRISQSFSSIDSSWFHNICYLILSTVVCRPLSSSKAFWTRSSHILLQSRDILLSANCCCIVGKPFYLNFKINR